MFSGCNADDISEVCGSDTIWCKEILTYPNIIQTSLYHPKTIELVMRLQIWSVGLDMMIAEIGINSWVQSTLQIARTLCGYMGVVEVDYKT